MPEVDYDKLASQHGGKAVGSEVDYDALAKQMGGSLVEQQQAEEPKPAGPPARQPGEMPYYSVPPVKPEHFDLNTTEGKINSGLGAASGAVALGPAGIIGAGRAYLGSKIAGKAAKYLDIPEPIGELVGGVLGATNPGTLPNLVKTGHGVGPTLMRMLIGSAEVNAPSTAVEARVAAQLARKGTFGSASDALSWLKSLNPEQLSAVAEQVGIAAKVAAPAAEAAAPAAAKVLPMAAKATPAVAKAAAKAVAPTANRSAALMNFAKQAAERAPKLGEKIWMELDGAGNPVRILTPDQAGAAARAGRATTWVKNIFQ